MSMNIQELLNNNDARLILVNAKAKIRGWALKGSINDRACEILEHANDYLYAQIVDDHEVLKSLVP